MKERTGWWSERLGHDLSLVRWGHWGTPVLLFPTAGGDAEECERMGLVGAVGPLVEAGRIKLYSVDSVAGRCWLERQDPHWCSELQNRFDAALYHEVVPAIRADCRDGGVEIVTAGASIGAFNAVASLCRHPDVFRLALGLSGTYDLAPWLRGTWNDAFYFASPLHFLPNLGDGHQLDALRRRHVVLATGEGRWEDPGESWRLADVLGGKGIPNRVDPWGPQWDHDWPTWCAMLPKYLGEMA
ncbi:MAG TPA: alpha/beta hydrolase-fold protein [Thermoanaerobaculia bacterium]|nr:alpha/beta hydrolase-fold protein [Thermoanaerobaculia bacterium]